MAERERTSTVHLTRIYTRTGDDGTTALGDMSRAAKTSPRITAYADVDETNSAIGVALAVGEVDDDLRATLRRIQNELFDVGADLCTPMPTADEEQPKYPQLRIDPSYVERLEADCDTYNERVTKLDSFVLPGGSPAAALLHVARTIARRAERSTWALIDADPDHTNAVAARYLNRLSDLLFIVARVANSGGAGDVLWRPGSPADA